MVDYARPTPPMPTSCVELGNRLIVETKDLLTAEDLHGVLDETNHMPPLNQLTINEYWPGQGIASHTGKMNICTDKREESCN